MNSNFRDYTTGMAFSLQLSKGMVKSMVMIDLGVPAANSRFIASEGALSKRGLVKRIPRQNGKGTIPILTEEGSLVLELLKRVGLYSAIENAFMDDIAGWRRIEERYNGSNL